MLKLGPSRRDWLMGLVVIILAATFSWATYDPKMAEQMTRSRPSAVVAPPAITLHNASPLMR